MVQGLAEIGDATLGYFIDQARHDGHSWTEIGDALGVTKQAAQQRHTVRLSMGPNAPTFEHLTPRARSVASEAEDIARDWGHGYLGTEHLLLALYREPEAIAPQVLVQLGLPQEGAESAIAERMERGARRKEGELAYTPRAIAVFSSALSSALTMHHNYIGTEHLLLGLAQGDGLAAVLLREQGITREMLAQAIDQSLARFTAPASPTTAPQKGTTTKKTAGKKTPPTPGTRRT